MELSSPSELKDYLTEFCKRDGKVIVSSYRPECTSYSFMYKGLLLVHGLRLDLPFSGYLSVKHFSVKDLSLKEIRNISDEYTLSIDSIPFDRFKELLSTLIKN
tara:strand:- start:229 stop:537 length:309 start_codon:yes stop_codon:yes gene_type:complete